MEELFVKEGEMYAEPLSVGNTEESDYYATSLAHVLAELERLDILLRCYVHKARSQSDSHDDFQGLYISEQQVDELLENLNGLPAWAEFAVSVGRVRCARCNLANDFKD